MLLIKNGRVVDPYYNSDETRDLFIRGGSIVPPSERPDSPADLEVLDASGLVVAPGLVDMHVHFRDPGFTYKEDLQSGALSAAAGGVTTAACMPNTSPVIDTPEAVRDILARAKDLPVTVLPYAAVSLGQKGETAADGPSLIAAGAVGLSDDGNPVMSAELMREALKKSAEGGFFISSHCEDLSLVKNYAVNEGAVSRRLGLPGRPAVAEEIMVARDLMLAADTRAHIHIAHVSTAGSVRLIRQAKAAGVRVTAETCPQYFSLTEDEVLRRGPQARVNPPLRTLQDVAAIREGLRDGTLDAIATDHAPHASGEKARPLSEAPSGMVGLETSLAAALTSLYHTGILSLEAVLRLMSPSPAAILGLERGRLGSGDAADLVLFDPEEVWTVEPSCFYSKGRNTPFAGMTLRGKVKYTVSRGRIVYRGA